MADMDTASDTRGRGGQAAQLSLEQEELRGISRTVAEIHWLLLILVLLYTVFSGARDDPEVSAALVVGLLLYAALVMGFRYANFYRHESRAKVAIETWGMIAAIVWSVWHTGKLTSPLLNLFLLPVITSSLALSKRATLLLVGLIAACFVLLGEGAERLLSLRYVGELTAQLAPVLLMAYITTMFSADIRYGLNRAKLLAETDELTGLFNLRGFSIAATGLFGQATRYSRPACVMMVDSDNLKTVNDSHGHEAGNRLLQQLARCIRTELRHTDVPARYGGDEFIVLLPETPIKGALDVAERIRAAVAETPLEAGGERVGCTVSIGLACFPEDGRTLEAITSRADRAMYDAKLAGRNRVERYRAG